MLFHDKDYKILNGNRKINANFLKKKSSSRLSFINYLILAKYNIREI